MNTSKSRENLRALVEAALLLAVGFGLSYIKLFKLHPYAGSVTLLSMLPILIIGLRHGLKWGLYGALAYSGLQMLQGISPPPSAAFSAFLAVVFLDYIGAFTVLGLSGLFKNRRYGIVYGVLLCLPLRFLCHFISGIVIWGVYAPEDTFVWLYSLIVNGAYMGPELVFTLIGAILLLKTAPLIPSLPHDKSE